MPSFELTVYDFDDDSLTLQVATSEREDKPAGTIELTIVDYQKNPVVYFLPDEVYRQLVLTLYHQTTRLFDAEHNE